MRAIRTLKLFIVVVCQAAFLEGAWAGTTAALDGDSKTPAKDAMATNQIPISVAVKFEGGPGQIPTSRAYITAGTNKFAFLVPDEYKLTCSDPQKVTLLKRDGTCLISVRVIGALAGAGKAFDGAAARALIAEEHPDAIITSEFGMSAANATGPAFETQWEFRGVTRGSRVGFVPLRAAVLEFSVDASPNKLGPSLGDLNYVVLTFRASDEAGKLEATPLSDKL
jgi:hypothetical protein